MNATSQIPEIVEQCLEDMGKREIRDSEETPFPKFSEDPFDNLREILKRAWVRPGK